MSPAPATPSKLHAPWEATYPEGWHSGPTDHLIVEVGPGRGDWLFQLAVDHPEATVIGIEYKFKRFHKLIRRIERHALTNVRLLGGDARSLLPRYFQTESVERLYILFSDPWPKKRHAKHRLFQPEFVRATADVLRPGGQLIIAHDDPVYEDQIKELYQALSRLTFEEIPSPYTTFYQDKWQTEGRPIRAWRYCKAPS